MMQPVGVPTAGDTVEILLSTYNGAPYLDAMLQSLVDQTCPDWTLTVRDDRSSDATPHILERWRQRLPGRIRWIDADERINLGVVASFSRLLTQSTGAYVMFADQDDIWLPRKIEAALAGMRAEEARRPAGWPVLAHSDAVVVDRDLKPLGQTAWRNQGARPEKRSTFSRLMVENVVLGCTMMLNRPMVEAAGEVPLAAVYHDWWLALVASALGSIVALPDAHIHWRRHGANDSEMSDVRAAFRKAVASPGAMRGRLRELLEASQPRVAQFLARYRDRLAPDQIAAAEAFLGLTRQGFLARRWRILRRRLFFVSPLRTVGMLALI